MNNQATIQDLFHFLLIGVKGKVLKLLKKKFSLTLVKGQEGRLYLFWTGPQQQVQGPLQWGPVWGGRAGFHSEHGTGRWEFIAMIQGGVSGWTITMETSVVRGSWQIHVTGFLLKAGRGQCSQTAPPVCVWVGALLMEDEEPEHIPSVAGTSATD